MEDKEAAEIIDREHVRLLSIFHYVMGGILVAFSSLFIFHFAFALMLATHPRAFQGAAAAPGAPALPAAFGYAFAVIIGCCILLGWTVGGLTIYSGRCLARTRRRGFSKAVACVNCLGFPFHTILGVLTLNVLGRPGVKELYERAALPPVF